MTATMTKIEANNLTISLGAATGLGVVQFMASVYAAKNFEGTAKILFTGVSVLQGLGLVALSVTQGMTAFLAKDLANKERATPLRRSTAFMN